MEHFLLKQRHFVETLGISGDTRRKERYNSTKRIKNSLQILEYIKLSLTISQEKLASQYVMGLTPETYWRCLLLETLSSMRKMVNDAGMKDKAKMTEMAIRRFTTPASLQNRK